MEGLSVVKVKIYNLDGLTVFSTDPNQIGEDKSTNAGFLAARAGQVASELTHRDTFSAFEDTIVDRDIISSYVPIRSSDSGTSIDGVFEVYDDITPLLDRIEQTQKWIFGVVSVTLAILYGVLLFIVRQADVEIKRRRLGLELEVRTRTKDLRISNIKLQKEIANRTRAEEEKKSLLEAEHAQRAFSEALGRISLALNSTLELTKLLDLVCEESTKLFNVNAAYVWLVQGDEMVGIAGFGQGREKFLGRRLQLSDPVSLSPRIAREKRPIYINDAANSANINQELVEIFQVKSILGVPLIKGDRVVGVLLVNDTQNAHGFEDSASELGILLGSHAAVAIENARLFSDVQQRTQRLTTLREIDTAIIASLDIGTTLKVFLEQVSNSLKVDAANVLLLNPETDMLEYAAGRGFQSGALRQTHFRLGEGHAGRAALEGRTVSIPDLSIDAGPLASSPHLAGEAFIAYFAVPLITKGRSIGVLELFHRKTLKPERDWLDFLETLAKQAAIAIENAKLFADSQRSQAELSLAYDSTLEGWAKALELRDEETEGHTQRVTETTVQLASEFGFDSEALIHVRRGALLHDIGKIGIPDSLLRKPGPLTDAEWQIMHKHPTYAYELLSPITYLQPALDIPHCHHEKWDGTGYPRGLKAEQIPLAARLFTVVDVWDALRSDRPYRKAWAGKRVLEYLREQSGKHFDPQVLEIFLQKVLRAT